jgi:hypothetical protein
MNETPENMESCSVRPKGKRKSAGVVCVNDAVARFFLIVTDLTYALPGNSSVNTVQHAAIEVAVFSVSAVTSRSGGYGHVTCVSCDVCPFLSCISDRIRSAQGRVSSR